MANLGEMAKKGKKVKIFDSEENVDPNIYEVTGKVRSVIELINVETGIPHRVHKSRIAKVLLDGDKAEELEEVQKAMEANPGTKKAAKKKAAKKPKVEKVDFKELIKEGYEVWSKNVEFPDKEGKQIDGVKCESHCVFAPDKTSYRVFNTYNGSLGKNPKKREKNPLGVPYQIADEKKLDKKLKDLDKKGYKKRKK
jgi:hypothetical protein